MVDSNVDGLKGLVNEDKLREYDNSLIKRGPYLISEEYGLFVRIRFLKRFLSGLLDDGFVIERVKGEWWVLFGPHVFNQMGVVWLRRLFVLGVGFFVRAKNNSDVFFVRVRLDFLVWLGLAGLVLE